MKNISDFAGPPIVRQTEEADHFKERDVGDLNREILSPPAVEFHESDKSDPPITNRTGKLPNVILRAIALAYESEQFASLHITQRQILAALIRFSLNQCNPSALAYVKKATIAKHLNVSEATIYRGLTTLEAEGLIAREKQNRTRFKLEVVGRIAFTQKLLTFLGVFPTSDALGTYANTRDTREDSPYKSNSYGETLASVRDVNGGKPQSSLKRQPARGDFVRIADKAVPSDLAWLVQKNSLQVPALFLLMAEARKAGHRLSNVVSAAEHAITDLKGKSLFAYVRSLLVKPVDYAHVATAKAAERDQRLAMKRNAAARADQIRDLVQRYRGKRVVDAQGTVFEVDSASIVITQPDGQRHAATHERGLDWLRMMDSVDRHGELAPARAAARKVDDAARSAIRNQLNGLRAMVGLRGGSGIAAA